jgi:hypothetical protein
MTIDCLFSASHSALDIRTYCVGLCTVPANLALFEDEVLLTANKTGVDMNIEVA